ncbi:MAG: VPLPA-CTERM-specific exosortase XrtD [Gammaproteobacteria bacterium]|nr:VPLPA-CTERM-specific exosortase XrtD [Gammaproteobacteria bacterium]
MTTIRLRQYPADGSGTALTIAAFVAFTLVSGFLFWDGLTDMVSQWSRAEYSYAYVVPVISAYLLLRRLPEILEVRAGGHFLGPVLAVGAVMIGVLSSLSNVPILAQYGFLVALVALLVSHLGIRPTLAMWAPLIHLSFMIPLPGLIYIKLTAGMQLLSSELGVALIRALAIPVYLDGNIIDLGIYKLQVAEACSGLRYMFPLLSFGFLFAAIFQGPNWQRFLLFVSTVPITIAMNSLRVGVIGILVNYYGIEQAEGFIHLFEGWVIFLGCVALLFLESWALVKLNRTGQSLPEALDLKLPHFELMGRFMAPRGGLGSTTTTLAILLIGSIVVLFNPIQNAQAVPSRSAFAAFPMNIEGWRGQPEPIESRVVQALGADDHLVATYRHPDVGAPVNLYTAFFEQQSDGDASHSPEVCLPGGGYEIRQIEATNVDLPGAGGGALTLNRAIIQKGLSEVLVYFWFRERGRELTGEFVVKWYILWDGLTRNRTDGGLVRLMTPIQSEGGAPAADRRLQQFLGHIYPMLPDYIPD